MCVFGLCTGVPPKGISEFSAGITCGCCIHVGFVAFTGLIWMAVFLYWVNRLELLLVCLYNINTRRFCMVRFFLVWSIFHDGLVLFLCFIRHHPWK